MLETQLLKLTSPEQLFSANATEIQTLYRTLARQFHPDLNGGRDEAFKHLARLHQEALAKLEAGGWEANGKVTWKDSAGKDKTVSFRIHRPFELGEAYIGDDHVTWLFQPEYKSMYDNALRNIGGFQFPSERMETEMRRYLPKVKGTFTLKDGRLGLSIHKDPTLLPLLEVVQFYSGLGPKHVAWVISSALNISCYLDLSRLSHQDISLGTYFIDPSDHRGALLGGWWFTTKVGQPVSVLPKRTHNVLPWEVRVKKMASALTDQELIRALGREMLGPPVGSPPTGPMFNWLNSVATGNARGNYKSWADILALQFGERRFVRMDLNADDLYKKVGV
jgi:hypothetical protein